MGRHVTSQIAFKSLAVGGWGGGVGGGGPSLIIMLLRLQSVSQSVRTSVAIGYKGRLGSA